MLKHLVQNCGERWDSEHKVFQESVWSLSAATFEWFWCQHRMYHHTSSSSQSTVSGGQGFIQCDCSKGKKQCQTNRCKCYKAKRLCTAGVTTVSVVKIRISRITVSQKMSHCGDCICKCVIKNCVQILKIIVVCFTSLFYHCNHLWIKFPTTLINNDEFSTNISHSVISRNNWNLISVISWNH